MYRHSYVRVLVNFCFPSKCMCSQIGSSSLFLTNCSISASSTWWFHVCLCYSSYRTWSTDRWPGVGDFLSLQVFEKMLSQDYVESAKKEAWRPDYGNLTTQQKKTISRRGFSVARHCTLGAVKIGWFLKNRTRTGAQWMSSTAWVPYDPSLGPRPVQPQLQGSDRSANIHLSDLVNL